MIDYSKVYIFSNQPTTCPTCGTRSEIVLNLSHTIVKTEIHLCPNTNCNNEFVIQFDEDFDDGSIL